MSENGASNHNPTEVPSHAIEHEYDADTPASIAVVRAICALEGIDPVEMSAENGFVLYKHVDSNALNSLLVSLQGSIDK